MQIATPHNTPHFACWGDYHGLLAEDQDDRFPSRLFGFAFGSDRPTECVIEPMGAVFGFVLSGCVNVRPPKGSDGPDTHEYPMPVIAGQSFSLANGAVIDLLTEDARVMAVQRMGWRGLRSVVGPVERLGRLRYIDLCSDTLLIAPPLKGDPCLNFLHFPGGINQTEHTHPSTRFGCVFRGRGACETPGAAAGLVATYPLHPGLIFWIPRDGLHRFTTEQGGAEFMDVIAYHPDTDFGPTHEEHPMVNRTLVGGAKIDNTQGVHAEGEVVNPANLTGETDATAPVTSPAPAEAAPAAAGV